MEPLFDNLARVMASPVSRGRALKFLGAAVAAALIGPRSAKAVEACPNDHENKKCDIPEQCMGQNKGIGSACATSGSAEDRNNGTCVVQNGCCKCVEKKAK